MNLTLDQKRAFRIWARNEPLIREVYLFGSRAKGTARPDSDADIAVRFNVADSQVAHVFSINGPLWQQILCEMTGLKVALAHLAGDEISPNHEAAVREHGIRLYPQRDR